jgi:hypothetical protein
LWQKTRPVAPDGFFFARAFVQVLRQIKGLDAKKPALSLSEAYKVFTIRAPGI